MYNGKIKDNRASQMGVISDGEELKNTIYFSNRIAYNKFKIFFIDNFASKCFMEIFYKKNNDYF